MLPLIYTNPVATGVFVAACLIWLVPEIIGMLPQMAKVSRTAVLIQDRGSLVVLIGLQWVGLALNFSLASLFPAAAIPRQQTTLFVLGVIAILLGVALRWYAIWTLGRFFTRDVAVSLDQPVVHHCYYCLARVCTLIQKNLRIDLRLTSRLNLCTIC